MHIVQILPDLRIGGAEFVAVNLANELVKLGHDSEIWLFEKRGAYLNNLDPRVCVRSLDCKRVRFLPLRLFFFLRKFSADQLIAHMWPYTSLITLTWLFSRNKAKLTVLEQVSVSDYLKREFNYSFWILKIIISISHRLATNVVTISRGTVKDLSEVMNIKEDKIKLINNPIVNLPLPSKEMRGEHSFRKNVWGTKAKYCLLSIGTLKPQKNQILLVEAFANIAKDVDANLVILGDGSERGVLEKRIAELNLTNRIFLPGGKPNPYPYLLAADLFIMSSDYEGLTTIIVQSLSCGTPVLSTDCPHGPFEILCNGKYGTLVPMNNSYLLGKEILNSLSRKWDFDFLQKRSLDFSSKKQTLKYLDLFECN